MSPDQFTASHGRWPLQQFRLRSLVIGISIFAVVLAPVRAEIARCQAIAALTDQIVSCQGEVYFDYQLIEEGVVLRQLESDQPSWLRDALGDYAFANIVEVRLEGQSADSTIIRQIGENCPKLLHLCLKAARVSSESMKSISRCKYLQQLDLSNAQISDEGLMYFAGHQHLSTLCLENTQMAGASFKILAQMKSLRILTLDHAQVDDDDLARLADSRTIEMIFLAGTEVTDDVIPHLARMPSLRTVSLHNTRVSAWGRKKLQELRPEISQI